MDGDTLARLAYLGLLVAALAGWLLVEFRNRLGAALRTAAAWGLIFLGLMAGYGLWSDIRRQSSPQQFSDARASEVILRRASDGHFYATLEIDGTELMFLVDTGATNMVLTQHDAERLGFSPSELHYMGEAATANGVVRTARVTLNNLKFGPFEDQSLPAYVNDGEMQGSLLGMQYLRRFSIRIEGNEMVLTR